MFTSQYSGQISGLLPDRSPSVAWASRISGRRFKIRAGYLPDDARGIHVEIKVIAHPTVEAVKVILLEGFVAFFRCSNVVAFFHIGPSGSL